MPRLVGGGGQHFIDLSSGWVVCIQPTHERRICCHPPRPFRCENARTARSTRQIVTMTLWGAGFLIPCARWRRSFRLFDNASQALARNPKMFSPIFDFSRVLHRNFAAVGSLPGKGRDHNFQPHPLRGCTLRTRVHVIVPKSVWSERYDRIWRGLKSLRSSQRLHWCQEAAIGIDTLSPTPPLIEGCCHQVCWERNMVGSSHIILHISNR